MFLRWQSDHVLSLPKMLMVLSLIYSQVFLPGLYFWAGLTPWIYLVLESLYSQLVVLVTLFISLSSSLSKMFFCSLSDDITTVILQCLNQMSSQCEVQWSHSLITSCLLLCNSHSLPWNFLSSLRIYLGTLRGKLNVWHIASSSNSLGKEEWSSKLANFYSC